jgi:hypothetical protein
VLNSAVQSTDSSLEFTDFCHSGYFESEGVCVLQCPGGLGGDNKLRKCVPCKVLFDRATVMCVNSCLRTDGVNGSICEQIDDYENCPLSYTDSLGVIQCVKVCPVSFPVASYENPHLCVLECKEN